MMRQSLMLTPREPMMRLLTTQDETRPRCAMQRADVNDDACRAAHGGGKIRLLTNVKVSLTQHPVAA